MKKILLLTFIFSQVYLFAQQETFRVKPFRTYAGYYDQNKVVITEEGKLLHFPQYLHEDEVCPKFLKDYEYTCSQGLIQIVDKDGQKIEIETLQLRAFNQVKANLVKIASLNSIDQSKNDAEDLIKLKTLLTSILKAEGKEITGYIAAVDSIMIGKMNPIYKDYFPEDLHLFFDSSGQATEKAKSTITVRVNYDETKVTNQKYIFEVVVTNPIFELMTSTLGKLKSFMGPK